MLTDSEIKALIKRGVPQKRFDGGGLFACITKNGSCLWRLKYRFGGKEKLLALGKYPHVSIKQARARRDEAKRLLEDGIDPSAKKKAEKHADAETFEAIAAEWLNLQTFKAGTREKAEWTFNDLINPYIGSRPISAITAPEILALVKKLEARGKRETAHRTRQRCSQVFRYAMATGRAQHDPTMALRGALAPIEAKNHASITNPRQIGALLNAIDGYDGQFTTQIALKLAPILFVRPGELRKAEWSEFDLDSATPEWRIPAHRMKMEEQHIVPLATQAVSLLRELQPLTGPDGFVFPATTDPNRPMSEGTITSALRRMGYSGQEMTWHGFRSLASTRLNELDWNPDVIELQLAHAERNKVRAAYNKAKRFTERRKMMQAWADYLDELRAGVQKKAA
jgi:integrase